MNAHPFRPDDILRTWCKDCGQDIHPTKHHGPMDDTANHPDHDGLRAQHLDHWTCSRCEPRSAARVGRATVGEIIEPDCHHRDCWPHPGQRGGATEDYVVAPPTARTVR